MPTFPYSMGMDRKVPLQGVYSAPNTTWTFPLKDTTLTTSNCKIILSSDFGDEAGTILTPDSVTPGVSTTAIVIAGNYSAGIVAIGRSMICRTRLARPFPRDQQGRADLLAELTLLTMNVEYQNLGYLSVRNVMPLRDDRLDRLLTTGGTIVPSGRYEFCPNGDIDDMTIYFESNSPKPCTVSAYSLFCDSHREVN